MTHCGLSSAVVQVICADDEEEPEPTREQAQMVQDSTNGSCLEPKVLDAMPESSTLGAASDMPARAMVCGFGHGLGGVRGQGAYRS
jgi:hypothetical protein